VTPLLEIEGVEKNFGGLVAVNKVSLAIRQSETVGLLGPNGSGKTTLLNMISGAVAPSAGLIRLRGEKISSLSPHRISHKGVARTFQLVRILPSLSVRENVVTALAFGTNPLWGDAATRLAMEKLELVGLETRALERPGNLTYIDQKRLELARALASQPALLLLDEWLAGLNPTELDASIGLIQTLKSEGICILLVEHIMAAVRALCERSIVMNVGAVIADGPTEVVLKEDAVIKAYLGEDYA